MTLEQKRDRLLQSLRDVGPCAVAYSGGVDSAVVAYAAAQVLGDDAVAITGVSASLASSERERAVETAAEIGIRHLEIETDEFSNSDYTQNAPDRCFHCKNQLYSQLQAAAPKLGFKTILNGANRDDLGDYRPGLKAASDHSVLSPLADCGFTKSDVRALAREWELPVWDKPASPCLSSRVAYGEEVTPERLTMIDRAEQFLRSKGLENVRVRYHKNDLARIEIDKGDLLRLCESDLRDALTAQFKEIGFRFVTLDLEGFRSGSLNGLLMLDVVTGNDN